MDVKFYQERLSQESYWTLWFVLMWAFCMICYQTFMFIVEKIWQFFKWIWNTIDKKTDDMIEKRK